MSFVSSHRLPSALAVFASLCFAVSADAALTKVGAATVTFEALGPAGMTIEGTTGDLWTLDDGKQIRVVVPLQNLATGISLRDRHMKEKYLEVAKYPNAELLVARSSIQFPVRGASAKGAVTGRLALHGVTHDVRFEYTARNDGGTFHVVGTVPVDMNDYNIKIPSYLGVTVKPDVSVSVKFDASDR